MSETQTRAPYRTVQAQRFRESTAYYLSAATGIPVTYRPVFVGHPAGPRDGIEPRSAINGFARFSILTRTDARVGISGAVTAATDAAEADGREFGVALWRKAGASISQGYAVMSIETFARLVAALELEGERP